MQNTHIFNQSKLITPLWACEYIYDGTLISVQYQFDQPFKIHGNFQGLVRKYILQH